MLLCLKNKDLFFSNKICTLTLDLKIILGIKCNIKTHSFNNKIEYHTIFELDIFFAIYRVIHGF